MKFSKVISFILHPIFMPIIVLYLGIQNIDVLKFVLIDLLSYLYIIVVVFTMLLPLITSLILKKIGFVSSLEMKDKKERRKPLLYSLIWMIIGFQFLKVFQITPIISSIYIGAMIVIFLSLIITEKWKISLHLLGIGGATGAFIALNFIDGNLFNFVLIFFFLSGILAYARLEEKSHTFSQVYIAFILGVFIEGSAIYYYNSIISTISILRSSMASLL